MNNNTVKDQVRQALAELFSPARKAGGFGSLSDFLEAPERVYIQVRSTESEVPLWYTLRKEGDKLVVDREILEECFTGQIVNLDAVDHTYNKGGPQRKLEVTMVDSNGSTKVFIFGFQNQTSGDFVVAGRGVLAAICETEIGDSFTIAPRQGRDDKNQLTTVVLVDCYQNGEQLYPKQLGDIDWNNVLRSQQERFGGEFKIAGGRSQEDAGGQSSRPVAKASTSKAKPAVVGTPEQEENRKAWEELKTFHCANKEAVTFNTEVILGYVHENYGLKNPNAIPLLDQKIAQEAVEKILTQAWNPPIKAEEQAGSLDPDWDDIPF
jgi:hypothetical protein